MARLLGKGEYVVYRDLRGRLRKFSPRVKLTAEVRSRKTNRKVRLLNKFPRRFTSKQRSLYHTSREAPLETTPKEVSTKRITLSMNQEIVQQIPDSFVGPINEEIKFEGYVIWGINVFTKLQRFQVPHQYYDKTQRPSYWKEEIRTKLVAHLRANKVRTSPKKISEKHGNRYWKKANFVYYRKIQIELDFRKV